MPLTSYEIFYWTIIMISLFLSIFWLKIFYLDKDEIEASLKKPIRAKTGPKVSFLVPAHNEAETIVKTLNSILQLNYPKKSLEIIVIDDGSTDNTANIVQAYTNQNIILLRKPQGGKASALNLGIKKATGDFVAVLDADSSIDRDSIASMIPHFSDKEVGAVVSGIRVSNPKGLLAKLQRFEYIFTILFRRIMTSLETLYVTPGALSLYRKEILQKVGGFDEHSLTEDMEIALKIHHAKKRVLLELGSKAYTEVPTTYSELEKQRVRWCRGHLENTWKYRDMVLNKEYGFLGMFQFPLNIMTPIMLMGLLFIVTQGTYEALRLLYLHLSAEGLGFFASIQIPTIKQLILNINAKIAFPLIISGFVALFTISLAHKFSSEKWEKPWTYILFFTIYPLIGAWFWMKAIFRTIFRGRREW